MVHEPTVVAPSLTPESYNMCWRALSNVLVVAPSLTPESYNTSAGIPLHA